MGEDKAMLRLGGEPLIEIAVKKLREGCSQVGILGDRQEFTSLAEIVPDRVTNAGPLAGIEAALRHAREEWVLVVPVDVPLLPAGMLMGWAKDVMRDRRRASASVFLVDGVIQPAICLLNREMAPFVTEALEMGERKVWPTLQRAAGMLGEVPYGGVRVEEVEAGWEPDFWEMNDKERELRDLWFANLNTPEEFAEAEKHLDALDT
jgi:molybdopterin-guanine dinucleotide biosynthesis protein A